MSSIKQLSVIIIGVLVIIIGTLWFLGRGEKAEKKLEINVVSEPAFLKLPSTLQVELPQNKKTARVEKNSANRQEIIFYSFASAEAILAFYKEWAPAHDFVFLTEEKSPTQSERIMFSLVPGLGANELYTHYFILEPKENETRVILSYSEAAEPQKRDNSENVAPETAIPDDFKIKF